MTKAHNDFVSFLISVFMLINKQPKNPNEKEILAAQHCHYHVSHKVCNTKESGCIHPVASYTFSSALKYERADPKGWILYSPRKSEHLQSSLHGMWGRREPREQPATTQQHLYVGTSTRDRSKSDALGLTFHREMSPKLNLFCSTESLFLNILVIIVLFQKKKFSFENVFINYFQTNK